MGTVNYGFFFFLLSKILNVNCLPNNPPNSIPFHGQNAPAAPNFWTGQPAQSVLQGMTNIFDAMNPNPSQNTYLNNNDNQQNIKYDQQYSTPQPYNSPHNYNQQYSMSQPYNAQPHNYKQQSSVPQPYNAPPYNYEQQLSELPTYNSPTHNYEQQSSVIQPYNAPQVIQKNQNQHSKQPRLYNLHPPSQSSGPTNSQSFGTIGPSLKEYQKQLPKSINQPIEILPAFGQPINNAKNQENIQQSSPPIPSIPNKSQLSQMASKVTKPIVKESSKSNGYNIDFKEAEVPDFVQPNINAENQNIIQQSSPPIPPIPNQPQLSQMASKLSKPIVKESSKSNGYNIDIKEAELPDFGQPNINAKNQNIIQQSSPPISPIPNQPQLSQMASKLSKPIVKESSKSNGYNIDIKEAEVPDLGQPISNSKNKKNIQQSSSPNEYDTEIKEEVPDFNQVIYNAENQGNNPSSAPSFPHIPNQFQLSKPIVKGSSTSDGYNVDNEEAEVPDFGQPKSNSKNQENVQQSSSPIPSIPNQSQLSQMASKLSKPIVKESSKSNGYNIDIKKSELPDFGQPNIYSKDQNNIQQSSPPIPPTPNQPQLSQMASKLTKPIVKESSKSNGYNIDIKEAELPDFGQPNINAKNQNITQQSSPLISPIPNQPQLSQMASKLTKPIVKESSKSNGYNIDIKEAEVPDLGQPISNSKNKKNIQQSSSPNEYDTEIKEEVPDFDQVIYNAENQGNNPSSAPSFPHIPNQFQLSKPIVKGSSTSDGYNVDNEEAEVPDFGQPKSNSKNKKNIHQSSSPNEYDTEIKEEVPDLGQPINNAKNQENVQQSSSPIPSIPHQSQLSQMVSKLSKPIVKESSKSNGYNIDIKKSELPDFGQPNIYSKDQNNIQQSSPPIPPTPNQPQLSQMASKLTKPIVKESSKSNGYNIDIKEAEVPDFVQPNINAKNQNIIQQSSPPISSIPNQFQLSKPIVKESFTPNGYDIEIKEEVPYFGQPINNAKHQENVQQSSPPNEYDTEIKKVVPDFYQVTYNAKNEGNKPSSAPDFPPNQSKISPIPSQSSSKLTLNENTMQIKNDNMSLNSLLGLPDGHSEPLINDFAQNVDVLIDNSQTDIQSFLNSENNNIRNPSSNVLENQDDFQLVFNDVPPQLPMNVQAANAIINSQSNDLISNMDLNNDTENLQNTSNEDSLPENVEDTELNEESKLEKAMSESPVVALGDIDTENDKLYSLENLVFDVPPSELDRISNYDTSFIVDTENPKNAKEDNAKITVYANPNDVHILQLSPKQSSTNDNSYLINNNLLNTPSTGMPLWYSSFPNGADYVEHFNSNTNKQLSNSFFNFNQNPAYNQIPMYLENSNYFNQQAAVDQNQITSKIQSPGLSLDDNQPSSMDNSGSIYKKVDLKNPPPNSSNSWSLLKKDYTKNLQPNQYDRYTSGDGTTRTSFFGTPLSSYQNSNQGILNLPSNDMFVRNMISVISNSVQAPLDGTKAIFDITSANFPRSSVSHIIRLTHAIVRSVMLNLRQTLNTFMKTLYGHRVKRDFNPFEVLHNLPGALVNKYSLQSTAASTTKNINSPYYNQPTTADQTTAALFTGQQTTADYSMSQSVTKNMLGRQEAYGNEIDRNYYGSQNNNIGVVPQPASTQNYVLNSLIDAITSAVRSNVPAPYSIDSPEVKQYTQQVIVTAEIVFKNQIDNTLHGQSPTLNMY